MVVAQTQTALVRNLLPAFVRDSDSSLVPFVVAYHEWLEQTKGEVLYVDGAGNEVLREDYGPTDVLRRFLAENRINTSLDEFIEYLKAELAAGIPLTTSANDRLLVSRILDVFETMGNEDGLRLLFRALYDREIRVVRPGDRLLRPSDSSWSRRDSIAVLGTFTDPLEGMRVVGRPSNAFGDVQEVRFENRFGVDVTVLFVTNVFGTFGIDDTVVCVSEGTQIGEIYGTVGPLASVDVTSPGIRHEVGDRISLRANAGINAVGVVREVSAAGAITFRLSNGGDGYRTNNLDEIEVFVSGPGEDANFRVTSVAVTNPNFTYFDEPIGGVASVPLNRDPFGTAGAATSFTPSTRLRAANVDTAIRDALREIMESIGTIETIEVLDTGFGYVFDPTVRVTDPVISVIPGDLGENAIVVPSAIQGSIESMEVVERGQNYVHGERLTFVNTSNDQASGGLGTALVDPLARDVGNYGNSRGWLSSDDRLQDGRYYQDNSYVVESDMSGRNFNQDLVTLFNPGGSKNFSQVELFEPATFVTANPFLDANNVIAHLDPTPRTSAVIEGMGTAVTDVARLIITDPGGVLFRLVSGGGGYRFNMAAQTNGNYDGRFDISIDGTGTGATFRVTSIAVEDENFVIRDEPIGGVASVPLNRDPFGTAGAATSFTPSTRLRAANVDDPIGESLDDTAYMIGRIETIETTSNGMNYLNADGSFAPPVIRITDPIVSRIPGSDLGENAVIVGDATGVVR